MNIIIQSPTTFSSPKKKKKQQTWTVYQNKLVPKYLVSTFEHQEPCSLIEDLGKRGSSYEVRVMRFASYYNYL